MVTRPLDARDVEDVLAIQAACREIAQWSMWEYDRVARGELAGWVFEDDAGGIAGFIVARRIDRDLEILNFAVRSTERRKGIGAALLTQAKQWGAAFAAQQAFLEVRESNLAALQFYEKRGFRVTGKRPRYYAAPIEDALLLTKALP